MSPESEVSDVRAVLAEMAEMMRGLSEAMRELREGKGKEPPPWMRIPEYAERMGLSRSHVLELCRRKQLRAVKHGGWLIEWESARHLDLCAIEETKP